MVMIDLCFYISDKESGKEIYRSRGIFTSLNTFYNYIAMRYGWTSRDYDIEISGKIIND